MTILQDQLDFIRSPSAFVKRLATDPRAAFVGFRNVLAIAVLYEIAILLWAFGADRVTLPPFLRLPEHQYYFYELVFLIPLFLVTWLLASGIAYVTSKVLGGSGPFDAILGGFGLTMAVSAYFTLIPDYVQGILWTTGWVPFPEYQELTGRGILLVIVWAYMLAACPSVPLLDYCPALPRSQQNQVRFRRTCVLFWFVCGLDYVCSLTLLHPTTRWSRPGSKNKGTQPVL